MQKPTRLMITLLLLALLSCSGIVQAGEVRLRLATTTSTQDTGLLDVLNPPFEKMVNIKVDVVSVGTGKALKMGTTGDVDVVLVHAREAEDKFVAEGYGINRRDVMYNDFVIVGPQKDPAGIKGLKEAEEAFKKIAQTQSAFISRGDESGTHQKEKSFWGKLGIKPEGTWYSEAGQGMGAVLTMANEKQGYTLSDRATFLACAGKIDLRILCEGSSDLINPYGIIAVNPGKVSTVNYVYAMAYIGWVTSREGQTIIRDFGKDKFGQPLFIPTAIPNKGP